MSGRRRVLILQPVGEKGGAEVALLDVMVRLDRQKFDVRALMLRPGPLAESLRGIDIPTVELRGHRTRQLHRVVSTIRAVRRHVVAHDIEIIHANGVSTLLYATLGAGRRARVVWHVHDPLIGRGAFERFFVTTQRLLSPDWTIFGNPYVEKSYLAAYPRIRRHSMVLLGVDVGVGRRKTPGSVRQELGIPPGVPVIAMFARLMRFKGHLHLVEAGRSVLTEFPEARVVLCGGALFGQEPAYEGEVRKRVRDLHLDDRVIVTGFVTDERRDEILATASIVCHPADYEPFGIAVIEAMAAGRPVVAARAAGPSLTVADGETGLLVPIGDVDALAGALLLLLRDPARGEAMGRAGQLRAERLYSLTATTAEVAAIYELVTA